MNTHEKLGSYFLLKNLNSTPQSTRSIAYYVDEDQKDCLCEIQSPPQSASKEERVQFQQAAQRAFSLSGLGFPKWTEFHNEDQESTGEGAIWLCYPYTPGVPLDKLMIKSKRRGRALPLAHSLHLIYVILNTFNAIEKEGWVHSSFDFDKVWITYGGDVQVRGLSSLEVKTEDIEEGHHPHWLKFIELLNLLIINKEGGAPTIHQLIKSTESQNLPHIIKVWLLEVLNTKETSLISVQESLQHAIDESGLALKGDMLEVFIHSLYQEY